MQTFADKNETSKATFLSDFQGLFIKGSEKVALNFFLSNLELGCRQSRVKVSKSQKQTLKFSFELKNKRKYLFIFALAWVKPKQ